MTSISDSVKARSDQTVSIVSVVSSSPSMLILADDYKQLKGAPCSIQLFTSTMRDEECLQITKQIDQCLNGNN